MSLAEGLLEEAEPLVFSPGVPAPHSQATPPEIVPDRACALVVLVAPYR